MSTADDKKRAAAAAALAYVPAGAVIGVGTGSTANHFIEALAGMRERIVGAVASSQATAERLVRSGIRLVELNAVDELPLYVDGADQASMARELIKGGGGAHTREKIVAAASRSFVCVADDSKLVERLGGCPVPLEVLPLASRYVAREVERLGGRAISRAGFVTDNGNIVLDVHDLDLVDPRAVETALDLIAGVVASGLFCRRPADVLLIGTAAGVREIR